jgi:hypothetical protein
MLWPASSMPGGGPLVARLGAGVKGRDGGLEGGE